MATRRSEQKLNWAVLPGLVRLNITTPTSIMQKPASVTTVLNRFAKGNRWGAFFSGSLGWVVTEENFMKSLVEKDILNSLKLRLSYGQTGLDESAGRYAYMTTYNFNAQSYVVDGSFKPGFTEGPLASPDLTWYTTKQFDMGFDFASLQNQTLRVI